MGIKNKILPVEHCGRKRGSEIAKRRTKWRGVGGPTHHQPVKIKLFLDLVLKTQLKGFLGIKHNH